MIETRVVVQLGKRINKHGFKTDSVSNGSALCFCRPGVAITPGGQSSDMRQSSREAA